MYGFHPNECKKFWKLTCLLKGLVYCWTGSIRSHCFLLCVEFINFCKCYQRLNFSALNKISNSILILKERSCISVIDYREPSNQSKEEFNQLHSDASAPNVPSFLLLLSPTLTKKKRIFRRIIVWEVAEWHKVCT